MKKYYIAAVNISWADEGGVKVICEESDEVNGDNKVYYRVVDILGDMKVSNSIINKSNKIICDKRYDSLQDLKLDINNLCKPACEDEGNIYGYHVDKKEGIILTLFISKKARRTSAYFSKLCRCEFAQILNIEDKDGNLYEEYGKYNIGMELRPIKYDENRYIKTSGISFYVDKEEALKWI